MGMGMGDDHESEEEALSRSYPYMVQSPSSIITSSHANHIEPRLTYSSSRGSNISSNFIPNNQKYQNALAIFHHDHDHDHDAAALIKNRVVDHDHQQEPTNHYDEKGWIKYFSFSYSNSGFWILMQLSWRFLLSFFIALLVFYITAKPPNPHLSLKVAGIRQFRLGEGVDSSGVTTKLLSCNFSINLIIDNNSKLFALHIHPPTIKLLFGRLNFATSQMQGGEFYAGNDDLTILRFYIGTKNKPMYGAGRNMQDFLESSKGLPLVIRVSLRSKFNVIWWIFEPKFHHEAQCLVVLDDNYDKKHRTQVYNSTCVVNS